MGARDTEGGQSLLENDPSLNHAPEEQFSHDLDIWATFVFNSKLYKYKVCSDIQVRLLKNDPVLIYALDE